MIKGTGCDIVSVNRILKSHNGLADRIFTHQENLYYKSKKYSAETLAAGFAAKEAVAKALGTGVSGFFWTDIEICHNELGCPYVKLHNGAKKRLEAIGAQAVHISISHERENVVAFCIIE